ncbi:uncharacterized protein K460DRAFT_409845 [Cucurbitaria berberidis CBS 394.84]|uniref:Uncharacterized protein n=1 Tax=Cucurbitaria berberidis CBS 394.84 TaxID=1168544 RepID=A0A9P4GBE7_9PLEO|nr:uncharacterized protein K460DRAFT_409845 [Cucurbitaria berberidis CBS 394.84]KAF1842429.1 hypothetical protein K460DRAFT_409845 [Cucurbitaria berberidis CBS 394.84]
MPPIDVVGLPAGIFKVVKMNQVDGLKCPPHTITTLYENLKTQELLKSLDFVVYVVKDLDGRTRWVFVTRKDDLTKLNWLAKCHAQDMEGRIQQHADVQGVSAGGEGRPIPFVIVEAKEGVMGSKSEKHLLDELYTGVIARTKETDIDEIRIPKETIIIVKKEKPSKRDFKTRYSGGRSRRTTWRKSSRRTGAMAHDLPSTTLNVCFLSLTSDIVNATAHQYLASIAALPSITRIYASHSSHHYRNETTTACEAAVYIIAGIASSATLKGFHSSIPQFQQSLFASLKVQPMAKEQEPDGPSWWLWGSLLVGIVLMLVLSRTPWFSSRRPAIEAELHKAWTCIHNQFSSRSRKAEEPHSARVLTDDTGAAAIAQARATFAMNDIQRVNDIAPIGSLMGVSQPGQLVRGLHGDLYNSRLSAAMKHLSKESVDRFHQNLDKRRVSAASAKKEHLEPRLAELSKPETENMNDLDASQNTASTRIGSPYSSMVADTYRQSATSISASTTLEATTPLSTLSTEELLGSINATETELEASSDIELSNHGLPDPAPSPVPGIGEHTARSTVALPSNDVAQTSGRPILNWDYAVHPTSVVTHGPYATEYPTMIAQLQDGATGR